MSNQDMEMQNKQIIEIIGGSEIWWTDIEKAAAVIPVLKEGVLLHAGPPLAGISMCSAMRNAVFGAVVYEGWSPSVTDAEKLFVNGEISFYSAHDHSALGPMAGIISPSMPVMVMENRRYGNTSYVTLNEGLGRTLRFGANGPEVIEKLQWMEQTLATMLKEAIHLSGPVNITAIMSRAVQRGDECHNRNKAATSLLFRKLAPWLVKTSFCKDDISRVLFFIDGNDHFFLNFSMAATKATMEQAHKIEGGSIVTCMAANGIEFGIKVAGGGSAWFTAPAPVSAGNYFEGYGEKDGNPVMGDSYISETAGLGGIALAMAPGIVQFIGGTVEEAVESTLEMYAITVAEHPLYKIPSMGFRGTPLGIDIRLVHKNKILPMINTGIAHKDPGVGQIGAGRFRPPAECFEKACESLGFV